jgi:hypothetical protein
VRGIHIVAATSNHGHTVQWQQWAIGKLAFDRAKVDRVPLGGGNQTLPRLLPESGRFNTQGRTSELALMSCTIPPRKIQLTKIRAHMSVVVENLIAVENKKVASNEIRICTH